jgi:hypothetical protein
LQKKEKRNYIFAWFKTATKKGSLWHFHVCMYYRMIWFISSIFLLCTSVPFLYLEILYSFLYREYINHFNLNFLLLSSPSCVISL